MLHRIRSVLAPRRASRLALDDARAHLIAGNAQTLAWQCEVTRIPAPTGSESARAEWMAERFVSLGWTDVHRDAVGNVIARRPQLAKPAGDARAVWCCAHLDTVFGDSAPAVSQRESRLAGPGIGDNGRGLAALLALADTIHTADMQPHHEIVLACTVGEEGLGDLRGMKALMQHATPAPIAVIAIDGAGDDRVVNAALGSTRWRVTFHGAGGHSWADFGIANPVHAITALGTAMQAVLLPREPRTTLTIARIGGGESINSVPREAWLELDIRSLGAAALTDLARTLHDTVARIERSENGRRPPNTAPLVSRIEQLGDRPCGIVVPDAPLVRLAMEVTRTMGMTPRLAAGSTDASVPIALGIPAIAIGAGGRGGGTHTPAEWYDDTHGVRGLERALRIVIGAAELHG